MQYIKELKEKYRVDVFVAGGGPAGVAAAVAAARQGKSVFLAESQGSFGGVAAAGLVPAFAPFDDGVNVLAAGIGYELRKNVSRDVPLNSYWTPIKVEELKRAYDALMEQSGVTYSFFTTVCDVVTNASGDRIEGVVLAAKSGLFAVKASIYVDCTGDGDLCAYGGAAFEKGDFFAAVHTTSNTGFFSHTGTPNKFTSLLIIAELSNSAYPPVILNCLALS